MSEKIPFSLEVWKRCQSIRVSSLVHFLKMIGTPSSRPSLFDFDRDFRKVRLDYFVKSSVYLSRDGYSFPA